MTDDVQTRISRFKIALTTESVSNIVRQHLTFGGSYILDDQSHFRLKATVADHFEIHPSEVLVVGSAKLGFSIAPGKRYRPFNDRSDIDLAIISPNLFDLVWKQVFDYEREIGHWSQAVEFKDYLFKGWIRPDKLPNEDQFKFRQGWWEFFRTLTQSDYYGRYKIAAGLYKSWYYFESYASICVKDCKSDAELHG